MSSQSPIRSNKKRTGIQEDETRPADQSKSNVSSELTEKRFSLRDNFAYLTELVAVLGATIYTSGFVIVNAYLSQKGVSNVRLIHPALVPAGLLYLTLTLWSTGTVIACLFIILEIPGKKQRLQNREKEISSITKSVLRMHSKLAKRKPWLYILRITAAFLVIIFSSYFLSYIFSAASPQRQINASDLISSIIILIFFQGILPTFFAAYTIISWEKITGWFRIYVPLTSTLIIIFFLLYSLLFVAGDIYGNLPPSIGGGSPDKVILYITEENKSYFEALAIDFCPLDSEHNGKRIYASSSTVWMFWQFADDRRFGKSGESPTGILYISTDISTKPIVAIQGDYILALTFLVDDYQVC